MNDCAHAVNHYDDMPRWEAGWSGKPAINLSSILLVLNNSMLRKEI